MQLQLKAIFIGIGLKVNCYHSQQSLLPPVFSKARQRKERRNPQTCYLTIIGQYPIFKSCFTMLRSRRSKAYDLPQSNLHKRKISQYTKNARNVASAVAFFFICGVIALIHQARNGSPSDVPFTMYRVRRLILEYMILESLMVVKWLTFYYSLDIF